MASPPGHYRQISRLHREEIFTCGWHHKHHAHSGELAVLPVIKPFTAMLVQDLV